jgi:hypothetical protein
MHIFWVHCPSFSKVRSAVALKTLDLDLHWLAGSCLNRRINSTGHSSPEKLFKTFSAFYGIWGYTSVLRRTPHWTLSCASWILSTLSHGTSWAVIFPTNKIWEVVSKVRRLFLLFRLGTLLRCGDGVFIEVLPLASDELLTSFHPLLENVLQTVFHFEMSCLEAPSLWLKKTRSLMGRELNWILCSAWKKWIGGTPL